MTDGKDKRFRVVYISPPDAKGAISIAGPATEKGWAPSKGCMYCKAKVKFVDRSICDNPETYALFCPNCMEAVVVRKEWPHPEKDDPQLLKLLEEKLPEMADRLLAEAAEKFAVYMAKGKAGQA